jgi:hypothetical protein
MTDSLQLFKTTPELYYKFFEFYLGFKPYSYQKKFLWACLHKKRIAGKWSRQSGKSRSVSAYCVFRVLTQPTTIIITAPTLTQSSELYSKIRDYFASSDMLKMQVTRLTQTELILKNGSRIKALPSGSEGKSIRGFTADVIIEEEAGILSDEINNSVILPMLASKGVEGQLIKIGTPLTKNHFYRSCYRDPEYEVINVTWEDCVAEGQYSLKFIEDTRKIITDIQFQTEYEAKFIDEIASMFTVILVESCFDDYKLLKIL